MPSIRAIERASSSAWSAQETGAIRGWTVSSNGGFTRRLNSATADGAADVSIETRDLVSGWLADRGIAMTVRVTPLVDVDTLLAIERSWGLDSVDETIVMTRRPASDSTIAGVQLVDPGDEHFVRDMFILNGYSETALESWRGIVSRAAGSCTGFWIPGEAVGFMAVHEGIASLFSVAVGIDLRRQGIASRIMGAAFAWADERDVEMVALQVLGTNEAARKLYQKLGFVDVYAYRYLQVKNRAWQVA